MRLWRRAKNTEAGAQAKARKPWVAYTVLGVGLYVIFLLATLPAAWLAWAVNKYSGGALTLSQPNGSVWRGSAEVLTRYPPAQARALGRTEWRINPLWLAAGRLRIKAQTLGSRIQGRGVIQLTPATVRLQDTRLAIPASLASQFYAPASLASLKGNFSIDISDLRLDSDGLIGQAEIRWLDAGSALSPVQPLGDYRVTLVGKGKIANITLATVSGDLELNGRGTWNVTGNGQVRFNGTASPRNRAEELEPMLKLLGRDLGGGRRLLKLNTRVSVIRK